MFRSKHLLVCVAVLVLGNVGFWCAGKQQGGRQISADKMAHAREKARHLPDQLGPPDRSGTKEEQQLAAIEKLLQKLKARPDDKTANSQFQQLFEMMKAAQSLAAVPDNILPKVLSTFPAEECQELEMGLKLMKSLFEAEVEGAAKTTALFEAKISAPDASKNDIMETFMSWMMVDQESARKRVFKELQNPNPADWVKQIPLQAAFWVPKAEASQTLAFLANIEDEKLRASTMDMLGSQFASYYAPDKKEWDAGIDETFKSYLTHPKAIAGDKRSEAIARVFASRLDHETPAETLAWMEGLELPPDSHEWVRKAIVNGWSDKDPSGAGNWLVKEFPPEYLPAGLDKIMQKWTKANLSQEDREKADEPDLAAAAEWLQTLPPAVTDAAKATLAQSWHYYGEPDAARKWGETISDPLLREKTLATIRVANP